jgi:hypothetical protein
VLAGAVLAGAVLAGAGLSGAAPSAGVTIGADLLGCLPVRGLPG